jgi:hypothetical protein
METFQQRGVRNPEIIDLISVDEKTGEVVLTMVEDRSWSAVDGGLADLDEKCNRYFVYLLDGFFAEHYPQYRGRRIRVQLDCVEPPPAEAMGLLGGISGFADAHGMEFSIRVIREKDIIRAEWEVGTPELVEKEL